MLHNKHILVIFSVLGVLHVRPGNLLVEVAEEEQGDAHDDLEDKKAEIKESIFAIFLDSKNRTKA